MSRPQPADPVIAESVASWPDDTRLEQRVFGTDDPASITAIVDAFCRDRLGSSLGRTLFAEKSIGVVYGLELADGRQVVVKGHSGWSGPSSRITACIRIQAALHEAGFPAPRPLAGPHPADSAGASYLTAEELAEGEVADAHSPDVRRSMARALAQLVRLATPHASPAIPGQWWMEPDAPIWPAPHSPIFDLARPGGEWIDELALRARRTLTETHTPTVVGHSDWSVKNMRFDGARIAAVFDWDSLRREPEASVLGGAATHFTATWYLDVARTPSPAEMEAFLAEYEDARRRAFTIPERSAIHAAAVHAVAYSARCEFGNRLAPAAEDGEYQSFLRTLATETNL